MGNSFYKKGGLYAGFLNVENISIQKRVPKKKYLKQDKAFLCLFIGFKYFLFQPFRILLQILLAVPVLHLAPSPLPSRYGAPVHLHLAPIRFERYHNQWI